MSRGERYELDLSGTPPARTLAAAHGRQASARQGDHSREASRGSCCAACVASGGYWTAGHGRRGGGGSPLLRASSLALGGAARRWLLLAGAYAGAGSLPGSQGPGGSAEPHLGGGAAATQQLNMSARARCSSEDKITARFLNRDGHILTTKGKVGDSLLDFVTENNLDIDGLNGACEGTLACSTCHLIFEKHLYEKLDAITDEENDMLDLAYGLTDPGWAAKCDSLDKMTGQVPDALSDAR